MSTLNAGESRTNEDFLKVTPEKRVPAIDDNGFCLFERSRFTRICNSLATNQTRPTFMTKTINDSLLVSRTVRTSGAISLRLFTLLHSSAILKYIATKYKLPDHWYPSDVQRRAKVDEYLSWHASNLRMGAAGMLFQKVMSQHILLYTHFLKHDYDCNDITLTAQCTITCPIIALAAKDDGPVSR